MLLELPMIFELTEAEQFVAKYVGKLRYANARKKGTLDQKKGGQSCEATDREGFAAELLFARIFNLYPDLSGVVGDADGVTRRGRTYDVKVTKYENGLLLAGLHKKNKPCDFYVLFTGEFPRYRLAGFGDKESLLVEEQIKNLKDKNGKKMGDCYAMSQDDPEFKKFSLKGRI